MMPPNTTRRSFLQSSAVLAGATPLGLAQEEGAKRAQPLIAYVGTFSSPLRDVLPTQVDLPPGNGRGIHLFAVNRDTGAMQPAGIHEMGNSPSCLVVNAGGNRLYSANETERVGPAKEGTVSAFAINPQDGKLEMLNTVRSGGAGPTYVSIHPAGKHLLVANYFGGSVAVLPILPDGRLGEATDVKNDAGKIGPPRATNAPPGSFAFSGHDRTHAHQIQADPAGRFVLHVDLKHRADEWTRGNYPRSFNFDPTGRFLYCCNQRGDNIAVFKVDRQTGALQFTGHYAAVGNPSIIVFVDLAKKE